MIYAGLDLYGGVLIELFTDREGGGAGPVLQPYGKKTAFVGKGCDETLFIIDAGLADGLACILIQYDAFDHIFFILRTRVWRRCNGGWGRLTQNDIIAVDLVFQPATEKGIQDLPDRFVFKCY